MHDCLSAEQDEKAVAALLAAAMNVSLLQIGERRGDVRNSQLYMQLFLLWCCEDVKGGLKPSAPQSPPQFSSKTTWDKRCVLWRLPAEVDGAGVCLCGHLEEELRKLREETNVDSLRQELDRERSKRLELEQKMNEVVKSRWESVCEVKRILPEPLGDGLWS